MTKLNRLKMLAGVSVLAVAGHLFAIDVAAQTLRHADGNPAPSIEFGAKTYYQRCTLCHDNDGMGEGLLPLALKDYPATNLLEPKHATDASTLREAIVWGGAKGIMHEYSPPWGDELTWTEIESLVSFVTYLRENTDAAIALVKAQARNSPVSAKVGRGLFRTRCALCHGQSGEGDGKLARVINNPSPFNLTLSQMPDDALVQIIGEGGAAVGRSPRMPPWKGELSDSEIRAVIVYIKALRK